MEDKSTYFSKKIEIFWKENIFLAGKCDPTHTYDPRTMPHLQFSVCVSRLEMNFLKMGLVLLLLKNQH